MNRPVEGTPDNIITIYRELEKVRQEYTGSPVFPDLTEEKVKEQLGQNIPLIALTGLEFNEEDALQAAHRVFDIMIKNRQGDAEATQRIKKVILDDKVESLSQLLPKVVWQEYGWLEGFFSEYNLDPELTLFMLFHTARPFVAAYGKELTKNFKFELWQKNTCPVCGWGPDLAYEDAESGQRKLHCSLCDTKWLFKNLKCPQCLNEDHTSLGYFTVEDDEVFRVYVCEKCKGYIKSVKEGKMVHEDPAAVLDAKTLHLDFLAEREGYEKGMPGTEGN